MINEYMTLLFALKGARTHLRARRDVNVRDGTRDESTRYSLLPLTFNPFPGCDLRSHPQ